MSRKGKNFSSMWRRRLVRIAGDAQRRGRDQLWATLWHAVADGTRIPRSLRPGGTVDDQWHQLMIDPFVEDIVRDYVRASGKRL